MLAVAVATSFAVAAPTNTARYDIYRRFTGKDAGTPVDVNTIPKPGEKRSLTEQAAEFIRATFFIKCSSTNGPFLTERDIVHSLL